MAQIYCPGPVAIWVAVGKLLNGVREDIKFGKAAVAVAGAPRVDAPIVQPSLGISTNNAPVFLGHSERAPQISVRTRYKDIYADIGGETNPFDKIYEGIECAIVSVDLIRFNYGVLESITARAAQYENRGFNGPGTDPPGNVGSGMYLDDLSYFMWLQFPYSAKPAMMGTTFTSTGNAMPPGYRFFSAFLLGPEDYTVGTVPLKVRCTWYCGRAFSSGVKTLLGNGMFGVFDNNMNAVQGMQID